MSHPSGRRLPPPAALSPNAPSTSPPSSPTRDRRRRRPRRVDSSPRRRRAHGCPPSPVPPPPRPSRAPPRRLSRGQTAPPSRLRAHLRLLRLRGAQRVCAQLVGLRRTGAGRARHASPRLRRAWRAEEFLATLRAFDSAMWRAGGGGVARAAGLDRRQQPARRPMGRSASAPRDLLLPCGSGGGGGRRAEDDTFATRDAPSPPGERAPQAQIWRSWWRRRRRPAAGGSRAARGSEEGTGDARPSGRSATSRRRRRR